MIKIALVAFAVVVMLLIAFTAIDTNVFRWEAGAFAAFFAAALPLPDVKP